MPLYIRHLPSHLSTLVDEKSIPPNTCLFNPSVAHPILYIRQNVYAATKQENSVLLVDTEKKKQYNIACPFNMLRPNCNMFQGIEDLRICWFNNMLWFTATSTHASQNNMSEMLVGHFSKDLTRVERMSYVDLGVKPAKNVCPYVVDNKLHLLDIYTMAIYEVTDSCSDSDNSKYVATKVKSLVYGAGLPGPSMQGSKFRGSTSPVHLHGNTWGCVVHDIIFNDQTVLVTQLSYIHHWIEFDVVSGVISFISTPFWVAKWGIEFISGIQLADDRKGVSLYIGIEDKSCIQCHTTLANLRYGK